MNISTGQLAELVGARLVGPSDLQITGLEALDQAGPGTLTFVRDDRFAAAWRTSGASAALVSHKVPLASLMADEAAGDVGGGRALLVVANADVAMVAALTLFAPPQPGTPPGVHRLATVSESATIDPTASIGAGCVVEAGAAVGHGVVLHAGVTLGAGARVGDGTVLYPGVHVMARCVVGRGCILHSGVVIGADGFGYVPSPDGRGLMKIPHIGNVVIGDGVEIGANSCVDRGKFGATTIGDGTKIDNLVQIGHNCRVGRCCIICGQVGLAGSVTLGDGVVLGGRVAVGDGLEVGAGSKIGAYAGVINDVPPGSVYMGSPAGPVSEWRRIYGFLRKLGKRRQGDKRGEAIL
ncbi:MAG: UDP-3-O-(3-hydroxymyristoyl)glucosamine N-acyltransferase [Phycisphaeraceae bacterium]|nr:UDP-3-O-(3-hydroxymyristoyl)glucosamine N-acyltransferase [Phycisphaeraceae bacterium]